MSCSRSLLLVTNSFLSLIGAGAVGVGAYLSSVPPSERAFLQVFPTAILQGAMGLGAFILLVAGLGFLATCSRNRFFMYLYIFLTIVTFLLTAISVPYILLYVNDVATIDGLDDAFNTAALTVQSEFIPYAKNQPSDWLQLQDGLQCCGLSLSALYYNSGADNLAVLTGSTCNPGREAINKILLAVPPEGDGLNGAPIDAINLQKADPILAPDQGFFCLDLVAKNLKDFSIPIGAGGAVMAILQLLNIRAAFVVLYRVGKSYGGFVSDEFAAPPPMPPKAIPGPPPSGMIGRMSMAVNRMTQGDFFRPPPPPMSGGPNFVQDARMIGSRISTQFRGMGQGAAQFGNRVSMAFRGGGMGPMGGGRMGPMGGQMGPMGGQMGPMGGGQMGPMGGGMGPMGGAQQGYGGSNLGQGSYGVPNPYGNGQPQQYGQQPAPGRW